MMRKGTFFVLLLAMFVLGGCTGGDVSLVQDGTMNGYESTTIGKAFEASFDSPKWETFETDKGARVVQFTGKVSKAMHDSYRQELMNDYDSREQAKGIAVHTVNTIFGPDKLEALIASYSGQGYDDPQRAAIAHAFEEVATWKAGAPVLFQWTINTNGDTFKLTYLQSEAWKYLNGNSMTMDEVLHRIYN